MQRVDLLVVQCGSKQVRLQGPDRSLSTEETVVTIIVTGTTECLAEVVACPFLSRRGHIREH